MFSYRGKNRYIKSYANKNPLQVQMHVSCKKTFACISWNQGSLTVEAALALPLFLFVMFGIFSIGRMMHVEQEIGHGMVECGKELAIEQMKSAGLLLLDSKMRIYSDETYLNQSCLDSGMDGIHYLGSRYKEEEQCYYLRASYYCRIAIPLIGEITVPCSQQVKQRAFTGYDWKQGSMQDEDGQYVYVTDSGSVYHTSRECTHLSLSIQVRMDMQDSASWRKDYEPCDRCTRYHEGSIQQVYITSEGRKYHTSITCSGLKRTVTRVKKQETEGRKVCQRCGKMTAQ